MRIVGMAMKKLVIHSHSYTRGECHRKCSLSSVSIRVFCVGTEESILEENLARIRLHHPLQKVRDINLLSPCHDKHIILQVKRLQGEHRVPASHRTEQDGESCDAVAIIKTSHNSCHNSKPLHHDVNANGKANVTTLNMNVEGCEQSRGSAAEIQII